MFHGSRDRAFRLSKILAFREKIQKSKRYRIRQKKCTPGKEDNMCDEYLLQIKLLIHSLIHSLIQVWTIPLHYIQKNP